MPLDLTVVESGVDAPDIAGLVAIIGREYAAMRRCASEMLAHAVRIGECLLQIQPHVPRGEWSDWLGRTIPAIDANKASSYMLIATHKEFVLASNAQSVRATMLLLRQEGLTRETDDEAQRMVDDKLRAQGLARDGASGREIAALLGVSESTASAWVNPEQARLVRLRATERRREHRQALRQLARERSVRKHGGAVAATYALVRKALQQAERAVGDAKTPEVRAAMTRAMEALYRAEDEIVAASKASR